MTNLVVLKSDDKIVDSFMRVDQPQVNEGKRVQIQIKTQLRFTQLQDLFQRRYLKSKGLLVSQLHDDELVNECRLCTLNVFILMNFSFILVIGRKM